MALAPWAVVGKSPRHARTTTMLAAVLALGTHAQPRSGRRATGRASIVAITTSPAAPSAILVAGRRRQGIKDWLASGHQGLVSGRQGIKDWCRLCYEKGGSRYSPAGATRSSVEATKRAHTHGRTHMSTHRASNCFRGVMEMLVAGCVSVVVPKVFHAQLCHMAGNVPCVDARRATFSGQIGRRVQTSSGQTSSAQSCHDRRCANCGTALCV